MYLAYSLLTIVVFIVVSPYFVYQAIRYQKYIGSLRQRLGYLPIAFNVDGEESIWIHAVSVGEALTARALSASSSLPLDHDDRRTAGGATRRAACRWGVLFPLRLDLHRRAHAADR